MPQSPPQNRAVRALAKRWLYDRCPGLRGSFPYFDCRVFFPKNSLSFRAACEQGIFEADNLRVMLSQVRDDTYLFDIGANIGLMAIPVLHFKPRVRVVSFEPSPNTLPMLERTICSSPNRDRWALIPKAVGSKTGLVDFHLAAPENSLFDGVRNTKRVANVRQVQVDMTTMDEEWASLGKPPVSVIKCDIEGGELGMLAGASECLRQARPSILLEWNDENLKSFDVTPESLLVFARRAGYTVHAVPGLAEIHESATLSAHMAFTESFLLLPQRDGKSRDADLQPY